MRRRFFSAGSWPSAEGGSAVLRFDEGPASGMVLLMIAVEEKGAEGTRPAAATQAVISRATPLLVFLRFFSSSDLWSRPHAVLEQLSLPNASSCLGWVGAGEGGRGRPYAAFTDAPDFKRLLFRARR